MRLSPERLQREATATGFRVEILEKVARLLDLLDGFNRHPYLKGRLVLKGGTALNLFVFDVPRLSIDIDLNYVGQIDREAMLAERPEVERALEAVCRRAEIAVDYTPGAHAGGNMHSVRQAPGFSASPGTRQATLSTTGKANGRSSALSCDSTYCRASAMRSATS